MRIQTFWEVANRSGRPQVVCRLRYTGWTTKRESHANFTDIASLLSWTMVDQDHRIIILAWCLPANHPE